MNFHPDPIKLAKKLVSIPSESGNEKEISEYIFDFLKEIGLQPEFQQVEENRPNVLLSGESDILFNGHLDTVPVGDRENWNHNPYGEISGDRLHGRGSCDTKGTLACFLSALAENPTEKINCSFTIGEENGFTGIEKLMKLRETRLKQLKYCVNFEPTELRIVSAHKGQVQIRVTETGKSAHGSTPEKGENAVLKLSETIDSIQKFAEKELKQSKHLLLGTPTLNIGTIKGGTKFNVVPDSATVDIDLRILPDQNISKLTKKLRETVRPAELEVLHFHQPVELSTDSPLVKQFQSILRDRNLDPEPEGVNFTTEFSELAENGIQGIIFGAGSIDQAHKTDEYISLKQLKTCHRIFTEFLNKTD